MAGFSLYVENAILNWIGGASMPGAPAGLYCGLFSSDPTDAASGGTEVTTTIRTAGRPAAAFGTSTTGQISNSAIIDFGTSAGNATAAYYAIFDAPTGGNKLFSGSLANAKTATPGDPVSFAAGSLVLTSD